eukprot:PhM_4_TR15525/c0_g5_i1/m.25206/K17263/CAND1; cullin-associated NEDD8-dissociated protein 1
MSSTSFNWSSFSDRVKDIDQDRRYMALFDLAAYLCKEGTTLDDSKQKEIVPIVLGKLNDSHSDVQSQAVRVLVPLVKLVTKEDIIEGAVMQLSNDCLEGSKEKREIASIALKSIVEVMPTTYNNAVRRMTTPLVQGISKCDDSVKLEVVDILGNVVRSFGPVITSDHEALQASLIAELSGKVSSRKVITCLSLLCVCTSDALFGEVVQKMLREMSSVGPNQRKYIQLCQALSHTCGQRLGAVIADIMKLLLGELTRLQTTDDKSDAADEVREFILQAFESFVYRCPNRIAPHVTDILKQCQVLIKWDPNYEDDGEEYDDYMDDEDMDFEQEAYDQGADEDDGIAWRVRKAAARCITAVIETRSNCLGEVYELFCSEKNPILPSRFSDRQEGVRIDVFGVFTTLLKRSYDHVDPHTTDVSHSVSFVSASFRAQYVEPRKEAELMFPVGKQIVQGVVNSLKSTNVKVKCGCFQVLRELAVIAAPVLDEAAYGDLVSAAQKTLKEHSRSSTPQLKLDVLSFINKLLSSYSRAGSRDRIQRLSGKLVELSDSVSALVEDKHYLTVAEALRASGELVRAVYLLDAADTKRKDKAAKIFKSVFGRMNAANVDRQVKEAAIFTMSKVLHDLRQDLPADSLTQALVVLGQLLGNETTRLMTVKTIHSIAKVDLPFTADIVNGYIDSLAPFLRQVDVILRQHSIAALRSLLVKSSLIKPEKYDVVIKETVPLVSEGDLNLAHLALQLCVVTIPKTKGAVNTELVANAFQLVRSPLLQGHSLESMEQFLETLFLEEKLKFDDICGKLIEAAKAVHSKTVIANAARLIGAVVSQAADKQKSTTLASLEKMMGSKTEAEEIIGLQCIGEVGRRRVLPAASLPSILSVVNAKLDSASEDVKMAASTTLGKCTTDIMQLINKVKSSPSHTYVLMRAVREAIVALPEDADVKAIFDSLLPVLVGLCDTSEENTHNILAESIGEMAMRDPENVLNHIAAEVKKATKADTKTVLILAAKFTVSDLTRAHVEKALHDTAAVFLACLDKAEHPSTRRAAVLLLTAIGHRRPMLLHNAVGVKAVNALFAETPVDQTLLKTVDLGPFKHTVDEGIDLRKAVYEGIDILVDSALLSSSQSLLLFINDFNELVTRCATGAEKDINGDIVQLCFGIFTKLCKLNSAYTSVLSHLDAIAKGIQTTLGKKPDNKATEADKQKFEEQVKSALRALATISKQPSAAEMPQIKEMIANVQKHATQGPAFTAILNS